MPRDLPYVVAGAYAIYEHTGIYRKTKDLDLFFEPSSVVAAARALRAAGFVTRLEDFHWLAKATMGDYFIDLIYGMGNGVALIDEDWIDHSRPASWPPARCVSPRRKSSSGIACSSANAIVTTCPTSSI